MKVKTGYCYDDVLLVPKYSNITSRKNVDLSVDLGKGVKLQIPIISANMKNVTDVTMAAYLSGWLGGLPIIHRFFASQDDNVRAFTKAQATAYLSSANPTPWVGASIGVKESDKELAAKLVDIGCRILCIDVAHGDSKFCGDMTEYIANKYPNVLLIAGNVATGLAATYLANLGADIIKVGIGPGSLCTTRIETGNGVPQLTALDDVYQASINPFTPGRNRKFKIIADGGLKNAGDLCKALCFSDVVMLGSLLAGTNEAPGDIMNIDGKSYKNYEGSSTHKNEHIEGVKALVECKGPVKDIIDHLMAGLRSGCSYQGASNLEELRKNPQFVSISSAGLKESHPHSVVMKD